MTANCHPQPSLQVYSEPINHVTDFKYLGSKMASAQVTLREVERVTLLRFLFGMHLF